MIIERMEFRLRFGKAKDGIATWKAIMDRCKSIKEAPKMRMLTDLTGPSYTIIVEMEHRSFL
ncbi:MAG: hypothetical protein JNL88_11750, partial [Bacteroidia bacterium]|nr:hypothetical protein [Bacteroidia bacterium]